MSRYDPHPDQLPIRYGAGTDTEAMIEARVAIRAANDAHFWRLRLVVIESLMLTALVLGFGLASHHTLLDTLRFAAIVGMVCLLSGCLLAVATDLIGTLLQFCSTRLTRWFNTRRRS